MSAVDSLMSDAPLPPSRNRSSVARKIALVAFLVGLIALGVWAFLQLRSTAEANDYPGPGTGSVTVVVKSGDSLTAIGRALVEADVVRSVDAFLKVTATNEQALSIGPGRYVLAQQMSAEDALTLMLDPTARVDARLTLPEGLTLNRTLELSVDATNIPRRDFRAALDDAEALGLPRWANGEPEGFMFPATYELTGEETAASLLRTYVRRFDQMASEVNLVARAADIGRSPYDILIIASLIEAEVAPNDFGKAARVVYNRLEQDMPLQFDSTVGYALGINELQLSKEQLQEDSPFNTYVNKGLPPTPINSPGEAAVEAALAPAKGKWLYFVSVDPAAGITKFTANYDKFLEFKREFQRNVAAN